MCFTSKIYVAFNSVYMIHTFFQIAQVCRINTVFRGLLEANDFEDCTRNVNIIFFIIWYTYSIKSAKKKTMPHILLRDKNFQRQVFLLILNWYVWYLEMVDICRASSAQIFFLPYNSWLIFYSKVMETFRKCRYIYSG